MDDMSDDLDKIIPKGINKRIMIPLIMMYEDDIKERFMYASAINAKFGLNEILSHEVMCDITRKFFQDLWDSCKHDEDELMNKMLEKIKTKIKEKFDE